MKRIFKILSLVLLISILSLCLFGCSGNSFKKITGIKSFEDISKIVIVRNGYIVDGNVSGSTTKSYEEDRDIMDIYGILSRGNYIKTEKDEVEQPEYVIRIYVHGENGYIEYNWDQSFKASKDYRGKLKKGSYSMDFSNEALEEIEEIFYRY